VYATVVITAKTDGKHKKLLMKSMMELTKHPPALCQEPKKVPPEGRTNVWINARAGSL